MTAAYRLKGVGWFVSCVAVVLGFYLVSLQVAAERKKLDDVNHRIESAERDIRALQTEFDTRANLVQLEKWNGDTLALSSPTAGQFVADETQLAAMDLNQMPGAAVQSAVLVVPSVTTAAPGADPAPVAVARIDPGARRAAPVAAAAKAEPVRQVAVAEAKPVSRPQPGISAGVRGEAVAMLDRKLLSESTLSDLLRSAHGEASRRR